MSWTMVMVGELRCWTIGGSSRLVPKGQRSGGRWMDMKAMVWGDRALADLRGGYAGLSPDQRDAQWRMLGGKINHRRQRRPGQQCSPEHNVYCSWRKAVQTPSQGQHAL